eukprot:8606335-Pyramimonas_sp.AAC.1
MIRAEKRDARPASATSGRLCQRDRTAMRGACTSDRFGVLQVTLNHLPTLCHGRLFCGLHRNPTDSIEIAMLANRRLRLCYYWAPPPLRTRTSSGRGLAALPLPSYCQRAHVRVSP